MRRSSVVLWLLVGCGDPAPLLSEAGPDGVQPPPAALSLTPQTADFGAVSSGQTSVVTFTVANIGGVPSGVIGASTTGSNAADFAVQNSCTTLSPAKSCIVTVTFTAMLPTGSRTANLVVSSNPGGNVMAVMEVAVASGPNLTISPASFAFPDQAVNTTSASTQLFTVTSHGTIPTGILSVTANGSAPDQFTKTADNCAGAPLAGGASCTFAVGFHPTTVGPKSAEFVVSTSPGGMTAAAVSGTGLIPPPMLP